MRKESKNKKKEIKPATVLFVPRTPGGDLARRLREAEMKISNLTGDRIKIVEKAGIKLESRLHKSNPWSGGGCSRKGCLVCRQGEEGKSGDCRRRNILYRTTCLECKEKGKDTFYIGESARTSYERGKEHLNDFQKMSEESHMFNHQQEEHMDKENQVEFSMKVEKSHFTAFRRQVHEAVSIMRNQDKNLLNSKLEYNRCILPRLSVMMGQVESNKEKEEGGHGISEIEEELSIEAGKERKRDRKFSQGQPESKRRRRWKIENSSKRKVENIGIVENEGVRKKRKCENSSEITEKNPTVPKKVIQISGKKEKEEKESKILPLESRSRSDSPKKCEKFKDIKSMFENLSRKKVEIASYREEKQEKSLFIPKNCQKTLEVNSLFYQRGGNVNLANSKVNPSEEAGQPKQQPPFDRGKQSENKAHPSLSQDRPPHHHPPANMPQLNRTKSTRIKASVKPPASYEYKPIYKHFQLKVVHPDNVKKDRPVLQTDIGDEVTSATTIKSKNETHLSLGPSSIKEKGKA